MVIKLCCILIHAIIRLLLIPAEVIVFPAALTSIFSYVILILANGVGIVACYTHFQYIASLLGFVISVDALMTLYRLVMWILKKIPFLNIK